MKPSWILIIAGALYLLSPAFSNHLTPNAYEGGRSRNDADRRRRNTSSVGIMFGELRGSFSDIIFIKTERYLHSGVGYMNHHAQESMSVSNEILEMDDHQSGVGKPAHKHEGEEISEGQTIIRSAEDDFRGLIGRLQREIKPWKDSDDPHAHTDGAELLPWYRIMTLTDPHNIRGYAIGGWWLKSQNIDEAAKFVQEGIENNPEAFQLHLILGQIYYQQGRDAADKGLPFGTEVKQGTISDQFYKKAIQVYRKAAKFALEQRPKDWDPEEDEGNVFWDYYKDEDALSSIRHAVLTEQYHGSKQEALKLARQYQKQIDDAILKRVIEKLSKSQESE